MSSHLPRLAGGAGAQAVRLDIAEELLLDRIVFEVPLEQHGEVDRVAGAHRPVGDLGGGDRLAAGADAVEEVAHVVEHAPLALLVGREQVTQPSLPS